MVISHNFSYVYQRVNQLITGGGTTGHHPSSETLATIAVALSLAKLSETPITGQSGTRASARTQGFSKVSIKKPTFLREK